MESKNVEMESPIAYPKRFWMLFLLILSILVNVLQITEFTSLDKTIVQFYGVSDTVVSLSSTSYLIFYLLFFFPATIYTEKCGLRHSFVLGSFLNAIGLCVKCFALKPGRFWIVIVAQVFPAIGDTLITPSIPSLAATWFKTTEVATVVALAFAAAHCGLGFTFLFQGTLFNEGMDIGSSLNLLSMGLAGFSVIVFVLTALTVEDKPPRPPSVAQAKKEKDSNSSDYKLTDLLSDWNYVYISIACAIVGAVNFVIATIINQLILTAFPNAYTDVSINGLVLAFAFVIGSLAFGRTLDRTKKFRLLSTITTIATIVSVVILGLGLEYANRTVTFIGVLLVGIFTGAQASVTMDSTIELTYPFPETISISFCYCLYSLIPIFLTPISATLVDVIGGGNTVFILSLLTIPALLCLLRIKWVLKRQNADESSPLLK